MRRPSVIILVVGLLGGLALTQTLRPRGERGGAAGPTSTDAGVQDVLDATDAESQDAGGGGGSNAASAPGDAIEPPMQAQPPTVVRLERALRVHSLGWPPLAGCILANGGLGPSRASVFPSSDLRVEMKSVADATLLGRALARGGADDQGADAIVAPLTALVPVLDQLASLRPTLVYAAGWSTSRTVLFAPAASAELADRPAAAPLVVDRASSALFPSLYAMQLGGIDPRRTQILAPETLPLPQDTWLAVSADGPRTAYQAEARAVLSSSALGRLVPVVVVTSEEFLAQHEATMVGWLRGCLTGTAELADDPPRAIRRLGSFADAPEPAELVSELATFEDCSLRNNLRLFGLAGRPVLDMTELVADSWTLLHRAGLVARPAPDRPPVSGKLVAAAARGRLPLDAKVQPDPSRQRRCPRPSEDALELKLPPQPWPGEPPELARAVAKLAAVGDGAAVTVQLPASADPDAFLQWIGERFDISLPCLSVRASKDKAETQVHITVRSEP